MDDSILNSVKKFIGLDCEYLQFDADIIMLINSAISVLTQIGFGPKNGFRVTGVDETWKDFIPDDRIDVESVKNYVYLRVRRIFDPPSTSYVLTALDNEIKELEWRLNVFVDTTPITEENTDE